MSNLNIGKSIASMNSKLKEKTAELIFEFSILQDSMSTAILLESFISEKVMPMGRFFPKTKKGFNEFEKYYLRSGIIHELVIEKSERHKDMFNSIRKKFIKIDRFKPLNGEIEILQEKRNLLAHNRPVFKVGGKDFKMANGKRFENGNLRSTTFDVKSLQQYIDDIKNLRKKISPTEKDRELSREKMIDSLPD